MKEYSVRQKQVFVLDRQKVANVNKILTEKRRNSII